MRRRLLLAGCAALLCGAGPIGSQLRLAGSGPSLDLDFTRGALPGGVSFTRGSPATYFDNTGTLQYVAANVARMNASGLLIEESRTNGIRNPRAEGAVAGSPGTPPTNWVTQSSNGVTQSIVGTGTENGIPYVDVQFSGTTTATASQTTPITPEASSQIAASNGQTWSGSVFTRLVAGSLANVTALAIQISQRTSAGALISDVGAVSFTPTNAALQTQRTISTATLNGGATVAFVNLKIAAISYNTGTAINFTLRIGAPQLELGGFATTPVLPPVGTPAATTRATEWGQMNPIDQIEPSARVIDFSLVAVSTGFNQTLAQFDDNSSNNSWSLAVNGVNVATAINNAAASQPIPANINIAPAIGTIYRASIGLNPTLCIVAATGVSNYAGGAYQMPAARRVTIGQNSSHNRALNGYIRRVRYWPRSMSRQEMQGLTR